MMAGLGIGPPGLISPSAALQSSSAKYREERREEKCSSPVTAWAGSTMDSFCSLSYHDLLSMLNVVIIIWYGSVLIPCYL